MQAQGGCAASGAGRRRHHMQLGVPAPAGRRSVHAHCGALPLDGRQNCMHDAAAEALAATAGGQSTACAGGGGRRRQRRRRESGTARAAAASSIEQLHHQRNILPAQREPARCPGGERPTWRRVRPRQLAAALQTNQQAARIDRGDRKRRMAAPATGSPPSRACGCSTSRLPLQPTRGDLRSIMPQSRPMQMPHRRRLPAGRCAAGSRSLRLRCLGLGIYTAGPMLYAPPSPATQSAATMCRRCAATTSATSRLSISRTSAGRSICCTAWAPSCCGQEQD